MILDMDLKDLKEDPVPPAPESAAPPYKLLGMFCVIFIAVGVATAMYDEGWSFLTAIYVIVQIITTIGYGDFTVTTSSMKLFCAFYVILLLVMGAYMINLGVGTLNTKQSQFLTSQLSNFEEHVLSRSQSFGTVGKRKRCVQYLDRHNKLCAATGMVSIFVLVGTIFYATYENCSCSYGMSYVHGCDESSYDSCKNTGGYVKTWVTAFYMSVITLTTVGFGDHSPRSMLGRAFAVPWMLFGVALMANFVNEVKTFFFESSAAHHIAKEDDHELFNSVKTSGSSKGLTVGEYRCYMLLKMGLATQEQFRHIDDHFYDLEKKLGGKGHVTFENLRRFRCNLQDDGSTSDGSSHELRLSSY